jgi:hypothetical protein
MTGGFRWLLNKSIKKIIKNILPYDFVTNYEKRNADKTFYVIRREPPGSGLFSNFHWVLGHVIYALEKTLSL